MTTKTITITQNAYDALRSIRSSGESFTETILRVSNKRPLSDFFGVFDEESGERFENAILEVRKKRNEAHKMRSKKIVEELSN